MLHRLRHRAQAQEGFTLIELLVVILIIGILAAVAIPAFLNQKNKANDANVKSDINSAQTAEESYSTNSTNTGYVAAAGPANALVNIEPTLVNAMATAAPATEKLAVTVNGGPPATGYVITAKDPAGVTYTLTRVAAGTLTRTCTVPAGVNAGGCTTANGASGAGTW